MTASRKTVLFTLLGLCFVHSAQADWQYTKWGMSESEVIQASGGSAKPNKVRERDLPDLHVALVGPYAAGVYSFSADYMFDQGGRLGAVRLRLSEPSRCDSLYTELLAKYGKPTLGKWSGALKAVTWQERQANQQVQALAIGTTICLVLYAPLIGSGNSGL